MDFWTRISRIIIKQRFLILLLLGVATFFMYSQIKHMRFSYEEANLLPKDHELNLKYNKFLNLFGEEGNVIVIAVKDSTIFTSNKFNNWNKLAKTIDSFPEIDYTITVGDIKKLKRDDAGEKFVAIPLYDKLPSSDNDLSKIKKDLFENLPFYNNILYNKDSQTFQTVIYIREDVVNTKGRSDFIIGKFNALIEKFEKDNNLNVHVSGMPYIRTMNADNIKNEMILFVYLSLGVTALIFFFFFRSFRATFITLLVVIVGVVWAFGLIGWFRFEVTVLMALIPPLVIVIGVPNAVFFINKYQQEIKNHGNQAKGLQRLITKIGSATMMTNITTASGFATFIFTKSKMLVEFGAVASINIIVIFFLALFIIPIIYSFMPMPKDKHLKHLDRTWMDLIVNWMENMVRNHRITIYSATVVIIIASIIGVYQMKLSGSLIDDMPKDKEFYHDIRFFEKEFGGILPLEILINTNQPKGVMELSTLKKIEKLNETIDEIPELSKPVSVVNLVKFSKQAFYSGLPKYYQLPTSQDKNYILKYAKNSSSSTSMLKNFVDSTGQYARITTYMKDVGTTKMEVIEDRLEARINNVFNWKSINFLERN